MQKIRCPHCNKIMVGSSSTSKNKAKHVYYKCANCKTRINENRIEKSLMKFLNDMLDFFLIVDNSFKPTLNKDTENDIKKYKQLETELTEKTTRIKKAFIDGLIESTTLQKELNSIEKELEIVQNRLTELENIKESLEYKQDIKTIFNLKEIEKMKQKADYVKSNNLWKKLSKEQKQYLIKMKLKILVICLEQIVLI